MAFTKAELDLIQGIADGESSDDIAKRKGSKADTVREQVEALKLRLGASTRDEIVAKFTEQTGWANAPKDYA